MSDADFIQYQQFPTPAAAQDLLALLEEHGIPFRTSRSAPNVEPNFSFDRAHQLFLVHLRPTDFARANGLQDEENRRLVGEADPAHYLFGFSDAELLEVLTQRADWSRYDVQLAEHILRQRGHSAEVQGLEQLHAEQAQRLPPPQRSRPIWLVVGYATALLGGVLGIIMGWHFYSSRETLADGRSRYQFAAADRVHGIWMMALGGVALVGWTALRLLTR